MRREVVAVMGGGGKQYTQQKHALLKLLST
jgi:hypothetical protein